MLANLPQQPTSRATYRESKTLARASRLSGRDVGPTDSDLDHREPDLRVG